MSQSGPLRRTASAEISAARAVFVNRIAAPPAGCQQTIHYGDNRSSGNGSDPSLAALQYFPTCFCGAQRCYKWNMHNRALLILALLTSAASHADIFAYVDAAGVTHFSNVPIDERFEVVLSAANDDELPPIHPAILSLSIRYDSMIREEAMGADVDPELVRAVIVVESGFDSNAVSSAGAQGLMQLMPATAKSYGVSDVFDPQQNIRGGALYLRDLIDRYDEDYELVLAAYNAGENAVTKYGGRIPPYAETRNYIPKVLGVYNRLLQMTDAG